MIDRRSVIFGGLALTGGCGRKGANMDGDLPRRGRTLSITSADGTAIAYERWGAGPPLVLVDGAFCSRRFGPTDGLAPLLARRFTVHAYDRRGRGESGQGGRYSVQREIEDLQAVIGAAGGSARVFGISSGGALALAAAAQGVGVERLAVYEVPFLDDAVVERPPADLDARLAALLGAGDRAGAVKFYMRNVMRMPWYVTAILPLTSNWKPLKNAAPTLLHDDAVMGDFRAPLASLGAVNASVLALSGDAADFMCRAAQKIAATVRHGRAEILQGQTHDVSPAVLDPVLERYFA